MDSKLAQALKAILRGGSPDAFLKATSTARLELYTVQDELNAQLEEEHPVHLERIFLEREAVDACLRDYLRLLDLCDQHAESPGKAKEKPFMQSAADMLGAEQNHLNFHLARLRDALISEKGPYTHVGLNRLLHAQTATVAEHAEILFEELERVDILLHHPEQLVQLLPEEADWYREYLVWLESAPQDAFPPEAWRRRGGALGESYFRCDRDFFRRRYHSAPTAVPPVNLAVNAANLFQHNRLAPSTCKWFLTQAFQQLNEIEKAAMAHPKAQTPAHQAILDELSEVLALVQDLAAEPRRAELLPQLVEATAKFHKARQLSTANV